MTLTVREGIIEKCCEIFQLDNGTGHHSCKTPYNSVRGLYCVGHLHLGPWLMSRLRCLDRFPKKLDLDFLSSGKRNTSVPLLSSDPHGRWDQSRNTINSLFPSVLPFLLFLLFIYFPHIYFRPFPFRLLWPKGPRSVKLVIGLPYCRKKLVTIYLKNNYTEIVFLIIVSFPL